jgi:two-component system NtrC family response regulator
VFRVGQLCEQYGLPLKGFDQDLFHVLEGYSWPGNVRELFNVLERAVVASGSARTLYAMHLPQDVRIKVAKALPPSWAREPIEARLRSGWQGPAAGLPLFRAKPTGTLPGQTSTLKACRTWWSAAT